MNRPSQPASARCLVALLFVAAAHAAAAEETLLRRYTPVTAFAGYSPDVNGGRGDTYPYMDVEDAWLSSQNHASNYGASRLLHIPFASDRILIAFRGLDRVFPHDTSVDDVELLLFPEGTPNPDITFLIYRLERPWRDGSGDGTRAPHSVNYKVRYSGNERTARPWGENAARGKDDAAVNPSLKGRLGDYWDARRKAIVFRGGTLVDDVRRWLGRRQANHGWALKLDFLPTKGREIPLGLVINSSEALETELRPALRIVHHRDPKPRPELPDLDVTFIERTPRYPRYHDNGTTSYERKMFRSDNVGIMKFPEHADEPKWPATGDKVNFTAHVKNAAARPVDGPVRYRWRLNDRVFAEGTFEGRLEPWAEWTASVEQVWLVDHDDHRTTLLEFEVDPDERIPELSEHNNVVTKYVAARTLKYWVERSVYEYVKDYPTPWGSYSFEDYLQWHFNIWNDTYLDKSRFRDVAPDGCLERVTLDCVEIVPDGALKGPVHRLNDQPDTLFDGEWGTSWEVGKGRPRQEEEDFLAFLRRHRVMLEPSLLHECSHQTIGAYDVYWSNIEPSEPSRDVGKCKLKDENGFYITRGSMYGYAGLMGGSDTRPSPDEWESTGLYEVNTIAGVNTNVAFRNGFYGEWQYDLPRNCLVKLLAGDGSPLVGAKVSIWQSHSNRIDDEGLVARDLITGADGSLRLPDQDSLEDADFTTITGHTLRKLNPFGRLDVVGENITLLLRIDALGQRDYAFVRSADFNRGYWAGQRDRLEFPVRCRIVPSDRVDWTVNVAAGAKATASCGAASAPALTDANVETAWDGGNAQRGDWIEIELPASQRVGAVRVVQDGGHGQFFQRFAISTRPEPVDPKAIAPAEPQRLATQAPERFSLAMTNDKDANPARPTERWVTYAGKPRPARVIRIDALDGGHARLSEIRVYAEK